MKENKSVAHSKEGRGAGASCSSGPLLSLSSPPPSSLLRHCQLPTNLQNSISTYPPTHSPTNLHSDTKSYTQTTQTNTCTSSFTHVHRQTGKHKDRQTDRHTQCAHGSRQTDRHAYILTNSLCIPFSEKRSSEKQDCQHSSKTKGMACTYYTHF